MSSVSVFGLGYVGCVSSACFAREGHTVIGVDVNPTKVALVNSGRSTIVEEGIAELVTNVVASGRLRATTNVAEAVHATEISLVCVGTPSAANGSLDLSYVERVCFEIGEALRDKEGFHTIVIRSTVLPGTVHGVATPALERGSGKKAGVGFGVCSNPEFLREGTSIKDFFDPPFTLIGADSTQAANAVSGLYAGLEAPVHVVAVRVAEMVKYACNCYHGLKVGFANEIGNICKALDVDSHEVMRIFCEDRKLNISAAYLKPGFAFGGSCLPKDLRAVTHKARELDIETPILRATLESNRRQIERAFTMIQKTGARRIGMLGLSFKPGTDDLRDSPLVVLAERLLGKGFDLAIYDKFVKIARLLGKNKEYIDREIPHLDKLLHDSPDAVLARAEIVVVGHADAETRARIIALAPGARVVDLNGYADLRGAGFARYEGICW